MTAPLNFDQIIATPAMQGPPGTPGPAGDFVIVTPSLSPYTMVPASAWIAVDTRLGPVTLLFPSVLLSPNAVFVIVDQFNNWAVNPVSLTCPADVTAWNPNAPGNYALTVFSMSPLGLPLRYKFSSL